MPGGVRRAEGRAALRNERRGQQETERVAGADRGSVGQEEIGDGVWQDHFLDARTRVCVAIIDKDAEEKINGFLGLV